MQAILIIIVAAIVGMGSYLYTKKADSPVEQAAEEVIDYELGLPPGTVDLTPEVKK
jgi:uncharacterized protein YpmB